jgi:hypothetical protein
VFPIDLVSGKNFIMNPIIVTFMEKTYEQGFPGKKEG